MKRLAIENNTRYTRLVVVGEIPSAHGRRFRCRCDCGRFVDVGLPELRSGDTKSCGCYRTDAVTRYNRTHGLSGSPEHRVWKGMKQRCENPQTPRYPDYGGRGITICERWRESFLNFLADMGQRPSPAHTLERLDNERGYSQNNCQWVTHTRQNRNTRANVFITYNGQTRCLAEWAEITGIHRKTIRARLKNGWTVERALRITPQ